MLALPRTPFDGNLPGYHSYLGLTDEHKTNFPEYTLLSNGDKLECPLIASKFCLFPNEIFPVLTDDGDAIALFERVRNSQNGYLFHVSRESNDDRNCYGVLLQMTHFNTEEQTVFAKLTALQIFHFTELRLGLYGIETFIMNFKVVGTAIFETINELSIFACDSEWIKQKRQTFEIPHNLLKFLSCNNWGTLKAKILRYYLSLNMDEEFAKSKLNESPASVSYYLVSNVPMTVKEKQELFIFNIEERIRYCLDNLVARFISITCGRHDCLLAKTGDFLFVSNAGICQLFVNPGGWYFNIVTIKSDSLTIGTSENTCYNWGYLICGCGRHQGWGYSSLQSTPDKFACIHFKASKINRLPISMDKYPPIETRETRLREWNVQFEEF